jgi:hypothetical protein
MSQETKPQTCLTSDFENLKISRLDVVLQSVLTSKEQLGYKWELTIQNTLFGLGIDDFEANPLNPILWKILGCGYSKYKENRVDISTYHLDIECKYVNHRVYPSHVKHNLIPRFTENGKIHVTVTNNFKLWSKDAKDEAMKQNIKIWTVRDLVSFYKTPSFISIYNFIKRNVSCTTLLNSYVFCLADYDFYLSTSNVYSDSRIIPRQLKSSTFIDILRSKTRRISNFIAESLSKFEPFFRVLSKFWNNKHGSTTLINWIPVKLRTKNKTGKTRSQKIFSCPFRIILVCPYYRQFYACLIQIIDDYVTKIDKHGYNEEQIGKLIDRALLRHTWKYKNQILGKCKCKPISIIDDEITSRRAYNGIAVTEPCKKMRCSQLIKDGRCEWIELLSEHRSKPKQFKLEEFMNGR